MHSFDFEARHYTQVYTLCAGFEILSLQIEGKVVYFVLGKDGFLNFGFGLLGGVVDFFGSIIAAASLNGKLLLAGEGDFDGVIASVHLLILRREAKHVRNFGSSAGNLHAGVEVVAVVEEGTAGAIGKIGEYELLFELSADAVGSFVAGGLDRVGIGLRDVAH